MDGLFNQMKLILDTGTVDLQKKPFHNATFAYSGTEVPRYRRPRQIQF